MEKEFDFGREQKIGLDLVNKIIREKHGKHTYKDVKKARVYLLEEIEKIILDNGGQKMFNDINFDYIEGCGGEGPSLDNRLYKVGEDGIALAQFIAGCYLEEPDFFRVSLGRYENNKAAYKNIVNELEKIKEVK